MDAKLYKSILKEHLLPSAQKCFHTKTYRSWTLLQDCDPKHKSKLLENYLNKKQINVLWNPPQSPDLNPIENVWKLLKDLVQQKNPKNLKDLE